MNDDELCICGHPRSFHSGKERQCLIHGCCPPMTGPVRDDRCYHFQSNGVTNELVGCPVRAHQKKDFRFYLDRLFAQDREPPKVLSLSMLGLGFSLGPLYAVIQNFPLAILWFFCGFAGWHYSWHWYGRCAQCAKFGGCKHA